MRGKAGRSALGVGSLLAGLLWGTMALAAQLVVVESHGAPLKPGEVIDDGTPLVLAAGQHVTLIAANGSTLSLDGPYNAKPTGDGTTGPGLADTLKSLVVQNQSRTGDVGVVRAGGTVALPDPWVLDVTHPGNVCVRAGTRPVVWRATGHKPADLTITPLDRSWMVAATWPEGADRFELPPPFPVVGRSTYIVELNHARTAVTVNVIPEAVSNDPMRAAWMIEKGCRAQAVALLKTIS